MAHITVPNRGLVDDRKLAKLHQDIHNMEKQMEEQAEIRKKVEHLQTSRTEHAMVMGISVLRLLSYDC